MSSIIAGRAAGESNHCPGYDAYNEYHVFGDGYVFADQDQFYECDYESVVEFDDSQYGEDDYADGYDDDWDSNHNQYEFRYLVQYDDGCWDGDGFSERYVHRIPDHDNSEASQVRQRSFETAGCTARCNP